MAAHLFSKRKVAYVLTIVCYREIACWEQYHSEQRVLNMSIYEEMLSALKEKLAFFLPFVKYMRMTPEEWFAHEHELSSQQKELIEFFIAYTRSMYEWEPAERIEPLGTDDIAEYLLCGRCKEACANAEKLNNALMKEINIDVHNRMYTLIETNRIK